MEIKGKIVQILQIQKGESANGSWQKQSIILETLEQYPKKICLTIWNNKLDVKFLVEGIVLNVWISVESREYKDKWFTEIKALKIEEIPNNSGKTLMPDINTETFEDLPWENNSKDPLGDIPF